MPVYYDCQKKIIFLFYMKNMVSKTYKAFQLRLFFSFFYPCFLQNEVLTKRDKMKNYFNKYICLNFDQIFLIVIK